MKRRLIVAVCLSLCAVARADTQPDATISAQDLYAKKLLTLDRSDGLIVPSFKFFENGKLTGALIGAPTDKKPLALAIHTIPDTFSVMSLDQEMKVVGIKTPAPHQTVLVYVWNGPCPPCDHIIETVKGQLQGLGWRDAQVLVVNILF
jgi:hypothetical protein